jgi:tricorn protease-like protein
VARVPLDAENYFGLAVTGDALIYGVAPEFYYGRSAATKPSLRIFTFKDRKETKLVDDIGGFVVSRDGSKVLVRQEQAWNVYDATPPAPAPRKPSPPPG